MAKMDRTFFTNEPDATLLDRFKTILKGTQFFDVLVGYFRTSGFKRLSDALEDVDKIRILVGLNLDQKAFDIIDEARQANELNFDSAKSIKEKYESNVIEELANSRDSLEVEESERKFAEFLAIDCPNREKDIANGDNGKKLEFRAYPDANLHAKVYISRYKEEQLDNGVVVTGSSNFSESGLVANREFNVQLKRSEDVEFALDQFETLWKEGVDISEMHRQTIQEKTWLNDDITPYELYLKFLYEYFEENINLDKMATLSYPKGYMELEYQKEAVIAAKKTLDTYGGLFLADVVGLGKTFIAALLAEQLAGKKLVLCPPILQEYWESTFNEFGVTNFCVESHGKLHHIIGDGKDYDHVFVDEAHRFRNQSTQGYEMLHEICMNRNVILVTATPLNNTIADIYSQLKLFQIPRKSDIPGVRDLKKFFSGKLRDLKKHKKMPEYQDKLKKYSRDVRNKVLKHVMIRRTREDIKQYYSKDIKKQGLSFPQIKEPHKILYHFDSKTNDIFEKTIGLIKEFNYARYTPLLYYKKPLSEFEQQSQRNLGGFMRVLLVKRLESSFYAFKQTIKRFIASYEQFIEMYNKGTIYIGKDVDIFRILDNDNMDKIQELFEKGDLEEYDAADFKAKLKEELDADLKILNRINRLWKGMDKDVKFEKFEHEMTNKRVLKSNKIIIFTESTETAQYIYNSLYKDYSDEIICFSGTVKLYKNNSLNKLEARRLIQQNFDPTRSNKKDNIRILISTDILSEGTNLHRANVVVNYDLPWNPTKVMQRVGRVNRVGTEYENIHIFNFFPTDESSKHINLEENIIAKIQSFHDTLGEDAKYLTNEEEFESHKLFGKHLYELLQNKNTYEGEEEPQSELKYLKVIRKIRDNDPKLFQKIKKLPKKARTARKDKAFDQDRLLTFFRKGKLKTFFITDGTRSDEIGFFTAAEYFECKRKEPKQPIDKKYYEFLAKNKQKFVELDTQEPVERLIGGRSNEETLTRVINSTQIAKYHGYTESDEEFIKKVSKALKYGIIPDQTTKNIKDELEENQYKEPLKILGAFRKYISERLLKFDERMTAHKKKPRKVVLSELFYR